MARQTTIRHAILWLLAAVALAACSKKPNWTEFEHPSGRFTVSFPTVDDPSGETIGTFKTMFVVWKGTRYLVGWQLIPDISQEEYLKGLDTSAQQQGSVTSSSRVSHAGLRGKDYEIARAGGSKMYMRYLRKGDRLYTIQLEGTKLDVAAPESQQFLASFSAN